jgi:dihydrofolate synthase/folylpolyglutamate synthase
VNPLKSDVILERMMSLHPKIIDLTLDRMWRLLAAVGHPNKVLPPVVHIAGTNGKGSTLAMIRAGLEGSGDTCHAYTSPHLTRFHERIRVAGDLISEPDLVALLDECLEKNGATPITYFEITTVAALLAFARAKADWTLLEVGLGGRLDATNVVEDPRICVITPIGFDHEQFLGDTVGKIAFEKAGILKPGVPCVVGQQHRSDAREVIESQAERVGAPLVVFGQDYEAREEHGRLVYQDDRGLLDLPLPNLPGPHQVPNAGAAIATLRALGKDDAACEAAVTRAYWPARMQRLRSGPLVAAAGQAELWLDGGHNPMAGRALVAALDRLPARPTHLIVGMLNTKDATGFLGPLAERADSLHAVTIPGVTATLTGQETAAAADTVGLTSNVSPSVEEAIADIVKGSPNARILICGSLYLAGSILRENS